MQDILIRLSIHLVQKTHKLEEIKHTETYIVIIQTIQRMKECLLLMLQQLGLVRAQPVLLKSVANGQAVKVYGHELFEIIKTTGTIGSASIQKTITQTQTQPSRSHRLV